MWRQLKKVERMLAGGEKTMEDDEMTERSMSPVLVTNRKGPPSSKPQLAAAEPAEHSQYQTTVCSGDDNVSIAPRSGHNLHKFYASSPSLFFPLWKKAFSQTKLSLHMHCENRPATLLFAHLLRTISYFKAFIP
jgi:hypothetical protein